MTTPAPQYQDTFPPDRKLRHLSFDWSGRTVFDVGCNVGELGAYVLARGAAGYRGSDINAGYIAEARRRFPQGAFAVGGLPDCEMGSDVVTILGVFHHANDDAVRATFQRSAARTIIFECPVGTTPLHNYRVRPLRWYLDLAAASGFTHSVVYPYGFAYPVDRKIAIVSRDAWDVAPRVDLMREPEYWNALGDQPAAIAALVAHDDPTAYVRWWEARRALSSAPDGAPARGEDHLPYLRKLIADLRDHGYRAGAHRGGPRELDFAGKGHGPITVRRIGTRVGPWDGAHRACILRALGRPVIACLWRGPA